MGGWKTDDESHPFQTGDKPVLVFKPKPVFFVLRRYARAA